MFKKKHKLKSWVSPKALKQKPSKIHGYGLFAIKPIAKGEIIAAKAGHIIDSKLLRQFSRIINHAELQISDDLFIAPLNKSEYQDSMIYFNHSCEPNAGFGGNVLVVAMKDIEPGEEVTNDYAMFETEQDFKLVCNCQTASCRGVITGDDWKKPELQNKYVDYFQWYIEQKIKTQQGNA